MKDLERLTEELLAAIEECNRLVEENDRMILVIVDQRVRERLLRDAEARRN